MPKILKAVLALIFSVSAAQALAQAQPQAQAQAQPQPQAELDEQTLFDLLVGEIAVQRNDPALAAKTFVELAKKTRDARIARRAVEVANAARLPELALDAARTWQSIEPNSPQALQVVAALLIAGKRVDDAEPYLERLLMADGVNAENGFLQLNRLLAGNPDKKANLRVVRQLAEKFPKSAQARFAVAQAALLAGDDALALAQIRKAQEIRPEWEAAAIFEAQVLQARSPAEASRRLAAYLEKNPDAREARLNYARALVLEKRFADARKQFEILLAANPGNPDVAYAVGLLAFQLKDYATAEENMKRLLGLSYRDPNQVRYILGQIAEEQKQWPKAIEWYQQIEDGEHAFAARLRIAGVMAKQGTLDEARAYLRKIPTDSAAERTQLVVAEAQLLREANRNEEAFKLLGDTLKAEPDQPEVLYDYALTAEKLQRFDVLETNLRKLMQVRPDYAHAYNALGYSFAERNVRLPEARKLVERALELAPEDSFIIDSMGWVLYRQGDLKGAERELRRAYNGRPDAEIGAHLGEVLWVSGDRKEAERVWRESLDASPDNESLQSTIKRLKSR
ncbi:MAG: tetratricopeptide repeat protein [Clostridia bacterium]